MDRLSADSMCRNGRRVSGIFRAAASARHLMATLLAAFVALTALTAAPSTAEARQKYAAIVIDKYSDRVLFSRHADSYRYPASLTKIMTLYITFEELAKGNIALDTRFPVSPHAAGQAPSKLGLKPGDTISVEDAILALVTKSANDVAVVVAEGIEGTEVKFAQRMTKTARNIGMSRTTFRNASGLPNRRQVTTARDMATLGMRVMDDFPQYYDFFKTETFRWNGRTYGNHNNLLGKYEGTNGIKTGYTRASGFNLTASVARDGKHLIGVVLGGKTPRSRDNHMEDILDAAFKKVPTRGRVSIAEAVPLPKPRPDTAAPMLMAAAMPPATAANANVDPANLPQLRTSVRQGTAADVPVPSPAPTGVTAADPPETLPRINPAALTPPANGERDIARASATGFADLSAWLVTPASAHEQPPSAGSGREGVPYAVDGMMPALDLPRADNGNAWRIQIGAYSDAEEAGRRIQTALNRAPYILDGRGPATVPVKTATRTLYRSRFTGFPGEDEARDACNTLIREGISCITVPPDDWYAPAAN